MNKIPEGWRKVKFGDVVNRVKDEESDRSKWNTDKYVGGQHFPEGEIRVTECGSIKEDEWVIGSAFKVKFKPGDVLYVTRNPRLRKGGMVDFEGICSDVTYVLRADENQLLQSLLPFIIQTEDFVKHTCNNAHGSTNPFLNWKDIAKYEFYLPPLEEQKKISEVLWSIEDSLSNLNNYFENLSFYISKSIDYYFEESVMKERCKKTSLREVIQIKHGFAFKGEYFTDKENSNLLLTPVNFKIGGGFSEKTMKYYEGNIPEEYVLNEGDLIVVMTDLSVNSDILGYPAIIPPHINRKYLHNQRIGKILIKNKNVIDKDFLYWLLTSRRYHNEIVRTSVGTTVHHTSPDKILDFEFSLPRIDSQRAKARKIEYLVDIKENSIQYIQSLKSLRNKLLNELLLGKVKLEDQNVQ